MDNEDDVGTPSAGGPTWRSADYSTQLQLNADEESQFSAFSSGHSATIFVLDASTDMLRTQLAGTNESKSAFQWGLAAVMASVRQLVFSNRNDHVGLVFFGCRQEPQLLEAEEFSDDSDELVMRTAHTVMYLHKAGLDTMRALYKLSKVDEDKIERQCESLTPGNTSASVHINVGEALWKTHRMLEYANQWFASKRVVILTNSDDPHGVGEAEGGKSKSKTSASGETVLTQKFTYDRASRLHEAGTEVFVVPFKLAADDEFDMDKLYKNVQKVTSKAVKKTALEISPDNVDDVENLMHALVESPIIKRPLCSLPLRLSGTCALQLALYHPITKFTKLPLLWLKSTRKSGSGGGTSSGADRAASNANRDGADDEQENDEDDDGGGTDQRMDVIKRRRVFVDPSDSSIVPRGEIKKRLFVLGREMIFSNEEAKSWKEFGIPPGMEVLASIPLHLALRFVWKNYIKPTLFATIKLTGEVQDQKATLKVFRCLIEACRTQSRALIVRYTPPPRLGTTRIALLVPDILPTQSVEAEDSTKKNSKSTRPTSSSSGFQMFLVPYIQELRDIVEKLYERTTDDIITLTNHSSATQTQLVGKYAELIDALRNEWTPQKYYNPAVYQYYLKLEAQVCKWPRSEFPKDLDDPSMPDYDDIEARAGKVIARLQASAVSLAGPKSRGGRTKQVARRVTTSTRGRGGRGASSSIKEEEEEGEAEPTEAETQPVVKQRGGRKRSAGSPTAKVTRGRSSRNSSQQEDGGEADAAEQPATRGRGRKQGAGSRTTTRSGRSSRNAGQQEEDGEADAADAVPPATRGHGRKRGAGSRTTTRRRSSPVQQEDDQDEAEEVADEEERPTSRGGGRTKQVARRTITRGSKRVVRSGRTSVSSANHDDEADLEDVKEETEEEATKPTRKPAKRTRK